MKWLSIDPGETAGWALWDDDKLVDAGQDELVLFLDEVADGALVGSQAGAQAPTAPSRFVGVRRFVIERFALYPWVIKQGGLDFDEVRTARGIGALEFIARHAGIEVVMQPATIKEPALAGGAKELFYTPLYENRHANDAIMHGWFYIATEMLGARIQLPRASVVAVDPQKARSIGR